jgi:hypothetical protein
MAFASWAAIVLRVVLLVLAMVAAPVPGATRPGPGTVVHRRISRGLRVLAVAYPVVPVRRTVLILPVAVAVRSISMAAAISVAVPATIAWAVISPVIVAVTITIPVTISVAIPVPVAVAVAWRPVPATVAVAVTVVIAGVAAAVSRVGVVIVASVVVFVAMIVAVAWAPVPTTAAVAVTMVIAGVAAAVPVAAVVRTVSAVPRGPADKSLGVRRVIQRQPDPRTQADIKEIGRLQHFPERAGLYAKGREGPSKDGHTRDKIHGTVDPDHVHAIVVIAGDLGQEDF